MLSMKYSDNLKLFNFSAMVVVWLRFCNKPNPLKRNDEFKPFQVKFQNIFKFSMSGGKAAKL